MFEPTIATFRAVGQLTCQAALMFKEVDFLNASVVSDVHNAPLDMLVSHARKTAQSLRYRPPLSALWLTILAALILWLGTMPSRAIASIAGEVVFAVGKATVLPREVPLQRGLSLHEGDVIVTEAGAHVHVRFADGALLSVRPNSRLSIERYSYRPGQHAENAVKFRLESGTARSITGKAGEEAKDRFRLNTPVAAIGVRGTDFVVATDAASSAVAVNSGAIVVSPIGGTCAREALGPCAGSLAKELSASMSGTLARVEAGKVEFMAIRELPKGRISPPAEQEPKSIVTAPGAAIAHASQNSQGSSLSSSNPQPASVVVQAAPVGVVVSPVELSAGVSQTVGAANQDGIYLSRSQEIAAKFIDKATQTADNDIKRQVSAEEAQRAAFVAAEEAKRAALSPSVLAWGRWAALSIPGDRDPVPQLQNPDFSKIVLSDGIYVLSGPQNTRWQNAREGLYDYVFRDAKVYLKQANGEVSAGQISAGTLSIDLSSAVFQTKLTGTHQQVPGQIEVSGKGYLRDDGLFRSSVLSAATITGVMVNQGREAAYMFNQNVNTLSGAPAEFAGMTRWGR